MLMTSLFALVFAVVGVSSFSSSSSLRGANGEKGLLLRFGSAMADAALVCVLETFSVGLYVVFSILVRFTVGRQFRAVFQIYPMEVTQSGIVLVEHTLIVPMIRNVFARSNS